MKRVYHILTFLLTIVPAVAIGAPKAATRPPVDTITAERLFTATVPGVTSLTLSLGEFSDVSGTDRIYSRLNGGTYSPPSAYVPYYGLIASTSAGVAQMKLDSFGSGQPLRGADGSIVIVDQVTTSTSFPTVYSISTKNITTGAKDEVRLGADLLGQAFGGPPQVLLARSGSDIGFFMARELYPAPNTPNGGVSLYFMGSGKARPAHIGTIPFDQSTPYFYMARHTVGTTACDAIEFRVGYAATHRTVRYLVIPCEGRIVRVPAELTYGDDSFVSAYYDDVTRDGQQELIVMSTNRKEVAVYGYQNGAFVLLQRMASTDSLNFDRVTDFNNDGTLDVLYADSAAPANYVLKSGEFEHRFVVSGTGVYFGDYSVKEDVNRDGIRDLLFAPSNSGGSVDLLYISGARLLRAPPGSGEPLPTLPEPSTY